jgi:hypothetical protein
VMRLKIPDKIVDFIDDWSEHIALYHGQNGHLLFYVLPKMRLYPLKAIILCSD